jgi:ferric-dicitrate binding protein FerR (iron transport regulator)
MDPEQASPFTRLADYVVGVSTPADAQLVEEWLAQHPDRQRLVDELMAARRPLAGAWPSALDTRVTAMRDAAAAARGTVTTRHATPASYSRRRPGPVAIWGVGAGLALGAVALVATLLVRPRVAPGVVKTPVRTYATSTGERATLTLRDGSTVTLAPQSTLQIVAGFGDAARAVVLSGEAYFEVANVSGAPFLVQTGTITTRVLGTAFDVRHYSLDTTVRVAVTSGKVHVAASAGARPSLILTAGAVGDVNDSSATTIAGGDAAQSRSWVDGQIAFREAPAREVLAAMTRWYGYDIRLADSTLATKRVTLWLSTESSKEAFATLKQVLDVDVVFDGTTATLSPRRRGAVHPTNIGRRHMLVVPQTEVGR